MKKLIEIRRQEVKVTQCNEWRAIVVKLTYQGVKLIKELSKGTWWAIGDNNVKLGIPMRTYTGERGKRETTFRRN